jgi:hypothetical protein
VTMFYVTKKTKWILKLNIVTFGKLSRTFFSLSDGDWILLVSDIIHNTSDQTEVRTQRETLKRFLFCPVHFCVSKWGLLFNVRRVRPISISALYHPKDRRWPLLGNSGKHVTAIARLDPSYYCMCIGKSKCF